MPSVFDGHLRVQVFLGSLAIPYQFSLDPRMFCGFKFPFVCLSPLAWPGQGVTLCNSGGQIGMLAGPVKTVDSESSLVLVSHACVMLCLLADSRNVRIQGGAQICLAQGSCVLSQDMPLGCANTSCNLCYGSPTS